MAYLPCVQFGSPLFRVIAGSLLCPITYFNFREHLCHTTASAWIEAIHLAAKNKEFAFFAAFGADVICKYWRQGECFLVTLGLLQ